MAEQLRALVIDDSRVMRNMVMESLKRTNLAEFEFLEATDGADGLTKFDPEATDIVFVDWNMPNMNGIDFVKSVRSQKKTDHIPIIMITSEKTPDKLREALDHAGASAFITKPFTVDVLQRKLSEVFQSMEEKKNKKGSGFFSRLAGG